MWGQGDRNWGVWCRDKGLWGNNQETSHGISGGKDHHNWGSYLRGWGMYLGALSTNNRAWCWDIAGSQRKHCLNVELYSSLAGPGVGRGLGWKG